MAIQSAVPAATADRTTSATSSTVLADQAVLARVADGELDAIQELYDRYRTMAYSIALRITSDASLAEDVVQDAYLGAWRNAARYVEGKGSVKTWLMSIVHHRAVDAVRRRRPTTDLPDADAAPPSSLTLPDIWPEVAGSLDRAAIASALAALTDVQREAIELAYFCGLTHVEIADLVGVPLGTVKSRIRLGLLSMRRVLTGQAGSGAAAFADANAGGRDLVDAPGGRGARTPSHAPSFRLCPG